jgi:choline dehydrogenase-like flavoprotein
MAMINADVLIVGSGAGGSVASLELVRQNLKVVLAEAGGGIDLEKAGLGYRPVISSIEVLRIEGLGGTTLVSMGNMLVTEEVLERFKGLGVDLTAEIREVCRLTSVSKIPEDKLPPFAKRFVDVAERVGLKAKVMPKSIDFNKCIGCGKCAYGCPTRAKISALDLIKASTQQGLMLLTRFRVDKLQRRQGEVIAEGFVDGNKIKVGCKALVLAAGALETPKLLAQLHDDENVGRNLFVDPFVTVGGPYDGPPSSEGIQMAAYVDFRDFLLSPHYSGFLQLQLAIKGVELKDRGIASIMVKVADEGKGVAWPDGVVEVRMTRRDLRVLERGVEKAKELLLELGVREGEIAMTHVRGAHPGGTAAIGCVVSRDLTITGCDGVFVADASLIPPPLGKPPILLIMSLAMKVARRVCEYLR